MVRPCGARGFGRRGLMRYLCSTRGRCHFSLAVRWQSARLRHRLCALRPRARETGAMATQYSDNIVNPNPKTGETDRHQVVFSHSLNARGRLIASGETEVVSPAKHKRDNAEAIF